MIELGTYKHYKGNTYRVIGTAKHSETLEDMVIYKPLYDCPLAEFWVRPLAMWSEPITLADGSVVPRFEKIAEL
ncbi:MAG: DUF1653 domain-containing protein [Bacillota bacterium]